MDVPSRESIVEALIFAADKPVSAAAVALAADISTEDVEEIISRLNNDYLNLGRAFRILKVAGGYQFRTEPEYAEYIRSMYRESASSRLSLAALETLAIIAYRQPISRPEIDKIRGVNVSGVLKSLIEKKMVTVKGRAEALGRPLLYGTTEYFLRYFGLDSLDSLPRESELQVILTQHETEDELSDPLNLNDADDTDGEQKGLM